MDALEARFIGAPIGLCVLVFAAGAALIWKGADWLTGAAAAVAEALGVPRVVVGATLVSVLTTLPEFAVSLSAALMGRPQTAVGNPVGSIVCNLGLVLGLLAVFGQARAERRLVLEQGAFVLAAGGLMAVAAARGALGGWPAAGLVALLAGFLVVGVVRARRGSAVEPAAQAPADGLARHIFLAVAGGALVAAGSALMVQSGARVARGLGAPELVIALTLVSLGTSLPELVVAVAGLVKRHADLSVGNLIGASFLDMGWALGVAALVKPLPLERQTRALDVPFVLLLAGLVVVFGGLGKGFRRAEGVALLCAYGGYLGVMFGVFV